MPDYNDCCGNELVKFIGMAGRRSVLAASMESLPNTSDPLRDLFEACKTGDIARVRKLVTPQTVNARDTAGRKSTPLHFAAGKTYVGQET